MDFYCIFITSLVFIWDEIASLMFPDSSEDFHMDLSYHLIHTFNAIHFPRATVFGESQL